MRFTAMKMLPSFARRLDALDAPAIAILAIASVLVIGLADYFTGYEVSMSLFYLGPVALAAWYAGNAAGIAVAVFSCASWYTAEIAAGHPYSHPAIPVWNALVRFGFFLISGMLIATLRGAMQREQRLARTDALTGLHGRRSFEERVEHDLALAQRRGSAISIAYIDLDDFKAINDAHGHAGGDRVLQAVGAALNSSTRRVDTAARLGGDEFALLMPDTDARGVQLAIPNLERAFKTRFAALGITATCSIGVVTFSDPTLSSASAVSAADALMYDVKRRGKGAIAYREIGRTAEPGEARTETAIPDVA